MKSKNLNGGKVEFLKFTEHLARSPLAGWTETLVTRWAWEAAARKISQGALYN